MGYPSDEEHSVLEDDSDGENGDDYMDEDDGSSSLSIPNESIDFDLVYALHSFAATVEGQANVVKGDSLFLMDDSNSYWWLVRVLKTQEVGYIPAENIETPFERLARLNKHRNVDLASATQAELAETRDRLLSSRTGSNHASPSPTPGGSRGGLRGRSHSIRSVIFTANMNVHRYPPAVWGDDEEEDDEDIEWDDEDYSDIDPDLAEELALEEREKAGGVDAELPPGMEPDDGISWEEGTVESMRTEQQKSQDQVVVTSSAPDGGLEQQQQDAIRKQEMIQQRLQQEQQRTISPAAQQPLAVPTSTSQEQSAVSQTDVASSSPTSSVSKVMDPAAVTETRKVSITPAVARSVDEFQPSGPLLPSEVVRQRPEERKRTREEIEALEQDQRKKANKGNGRPSGGAPEQKASPAKLRKERDSRTESTTDDEGSKDKKKKGGVLAGLFGRKKDKSKDKNNAGASSDNGSLASGGSVDNISSRNSGESGRSSSQQHSDGSSPVTSSARQQQQQAILQAKNSADPRRAQGQAQQGAQGSIHPQISQHATQLRQRDQQQQALYQQYLNRSPASPPEAQPSYGLQSTSAIMGSMSFSSTTSSSSGLTAGGRPRPGSLVLSPGGMDGQGVGLPDLSVIRVFAGENLQTEATFKTVLLNSSTTASDLVRQAIQRFRLPTGDGDSDYYLTIKQVEGSSAQLMSHERPLGVFESLVEAAMELPKVKRSSVGSISSVASNLSMHPAIKKLPMNDFTDDSAVKFYLNRKRGEKEESITGDDGEDTLMAESVEDDMGSPRSNHFLSISGATVTPERFSSPSVRFALQLVIHPEDLPDDMVFDPLTEAIVFKDTLRDRPGDIISSPGISQTQRKKIFVFPKNATVAEVIEHGLERFGIAEGVVDGGDEVEDKPAKRRSSSRVRYCLAVDIHGSEKELAPTSKVIDAYPRPPAYRRSVDSKRRSADSAMLLSSSEDIGPDDPIFILRRAVAYRPSSRRLSAPLDEIALQKLHRASLSISSIATDSTTGPDEPKKQMSKQEIIAAQRAATRANQRAILSAQANSSRGLDVLLPGNAGMIRSSRHELDDRMRYSYMDASGTMYDISDIVEVEWQSEVGSNGSTTQSDLLHGVISRSKDGLGAKLDRVLSQVRQPRAAQHTPQPVYRDGTDSIGTPSVYSTAEGGPNTSRSATPNAQTMNARSPTPTNTAVAARAASPLSRLSSYRTTSEGASDGRRTASPSSSPHKAARPSHDRQQSLASVMSDSSSYRGQSPHRSQSPPTPRAFNRAPSATKSQRMVLPKDDFGLAQMLAIIESKDMPATRADLPPLDPVDELLFGREIDLETLHPQIRDIYSSTFKQLEEMDYSLDELLQYVAHAF
ncbi:uncharacterized protein PHACADRAFT_249196 [Phanerochaete carnosa HHB-10118-sp]|uniref:SH3 domain-containing protein n=1 Tax=Phanerochaete carnosa (strain HHB-10118-sp) TaxID=650164 RepID=K5V8A4_PHACS|nr:uncharacterized protein PHACADRAFT_249196 [Phanerochaete carnosa HHB-10118-sp]EKM59031.1 hypothetical protein PHACADRAFT_249196 [Phanerochaete carnosa HHB-10118-sp]